MTFKTLLLPSASMLTFLMVSAAAFSQDSQPTAPAAATNAARTDAEGAYKTGPTGPTGATAAATLPPAATETLQPPSEAEPKPAVKTAAKKAAASAKAAGHKAAKQTKMTGRKALQGAKAVGSKAVKTAQTASHKAAKGVKVAAHKTAVAAKKVGSTVKHSTKDSLAGIKAAAARRHSQALAQGAANDAAHAGNCERAVVEKSDHAVGKPCLTSKDVYARSHGVKHKEVARLRSAKSSKAAAAKKRATH